MTDKSPNHAAKALDIISKRPAYEEWQGQPMGPMGEELPAPWEPPPQDPTSGARNEWRSFTTRGWEPTLAGRTGQYWSGPIDRISAQPGADKMMKSQALNKLAGNTNQSAVPLKPGKKLTSESGYNSRFIEDYNKFQEQYTKQHDENPEYWDAYQQWWAEVKRHVDMFREESDDTKRGNAVKLMRP